MPEEYKASTADDKEANNNKVDTGLACLGIIAQFHGVPVVLEQIRHSFAIDSEGIDNIGLLRAAKALGFKSKVASVPFERLAKLSLPAIAQKIDGTYFILAKVEEQSVLTFDPIEGKPRAWQKDELQAIWSGNIILMAQRGIAALKNEPFGLKWFIPVILNYRKPIMEVLLASFIIQLFGLVTPIFTQVIIDKVLVHNGMTTLNVLALGLIFIALFETTLTVARTYVFTHTSSKMDIILGSKLFRHLMFLPLRYFEVRRVGDTISRVRELENIRSFLTGPPLSLILDLLFVVVFVVVMFFYSSTLTWVTFGCLPFFIGLSLFITPLLRERLSDKFNKGAAVNSYLVESVSGVQTVKSLALEPEVQKKWEGLQSSYIKASQKTSILGGTAGSIGQFIQRATTLAILWFGAKLVMSGELTIGQLIAFQMLSGRFIGPVLRTIQMWQDFQQIGVSISRLGDILNTTPEPAVDASKTRLPAIRGHLKLEGVRFRYRVDGSEVIRNLYLEVKPGSVVGIVGRSGSGKSTLAKLIQRLYIPEAGKILVDGIDISMADPAWLRRQIGVVQQDSFLFNASVRDNIAIQYPTARMEDIVRVANLAGAHEFILELPEGYDTIVGERGTALSGGQRQRIAIARALLTNPRLLIFDEATSALDYESERIIQNNLDMICRERTVLIIAHRLSTIKHANMIIVLDRGDLIESGSHQELMNRDGLYHYLYSQQEKEPNQP